MEISNIETCCNCQGRKLVAPLGGISHKCPKCDGIGFITLKSESICTKEDQHSPDHSSLDILRDKPKPKLDKRSKQYRDSIKIHTITAPSVA